MSSSRSRSTRSSSLGITVPTTSEMRKIYGIKQNTPIRSPQKNALIKMTKAEFENRFETLEAAKYKGGNGRIDIIRDTRTNRKYAAKYSLKIDKVSLEKMVKEFEILEYLKENATCHPNINCPVMIVEITDAKYNVAVAILELGIPFTEELEKGSPFRLRARLEKWFIQALRTLDYMHSKGILHNDIKESNFLIHPDTDDLQYADVGEACHFSQSSSCFTTGTTWAYAPPEFFIAKEQSQSTDVYELGITFYQAFTWERLTIDPYKKMEKLAKGDGALLVLYEEKWRNAFSRKYPLVPHYIMEALQGLTNPYKQKRWTARQALDFISQAQTSTSQPFLKHSN